MSKIKTYLKLLEQYSNKIVLLEDDMFQPRRIEDRPERAKIARQKKIAAKLAKLSHKSRVLANRTPGPVTIEYGKTKITEELALRGLEVTLVSVSKVSKENVDALTKKMGLTWFDGMVYYRPRLSDFATAFVLVGKDKKENVYIFWRKETDAAGAGQTYFIGAKEKKYMKASEAAWRLSPVQVESLLGYSEMGTKAFSVAEVDRISSILYQKFMSKSLRLTNDLHSQNYNTKKIITKNDSTLDLMFSFSKHRFGKDDKYENLLTDAGVASDFEKIKKLPIKFQKVDIVNYQLKQINDPEFNKKKLTWFLIVTIKKK